MNIFKIRLSLALLFSLLIIVQLSIFVFIALFDFSQYKNRVNPSLEFSKNTFQFFLKNSIQKQWTKTFSPKSTSDSETPLKTYRLTIKQKDIDSLNKNLPISGKDHFVKAYLSISDKKNKIYKIKLRYRGDSNSHWLYTQKSLRIKLPSKTFNLINPPSQLNYRESINYNLSKKLGLISPKSIPVRVFINGNYMGVYLYLDQVDENLLREHKLMPGSIYYGDTAPIVNGVADLWFNQKYWIKKSSRNAEQKNNRDDIKLFIKGVNSLDKQFNIFAKTYLNLDQYFTFIALDRVFGTQHHDYIHNHKLYFDPYKGKFEPISWDLRFWLPHKAKDLSFYPLQLKLASNPLYDAKIDKIVYKIINNYFINTIETEYENIIQNITKDLKSDSYKDNSVAIKYFKPFPISRVLNIEEINHDKIHAINVLKTRVNYLTKLYNNTSIKYKITKIKSDTSTSLTQPVFKTLTLILKGNSPVQLKSKLLKTKTLYTNRQIVKNTQKFFPTHLCGNKTVQNKPSKYKFTLQTNLSPKEILKNISFTNIITNKKIIPTPIPATQNIKIIKQGIITQNPSKKTIHLKGTIHIKETKVYDKYTTVTIAPNTTFQMDANTSLYFYGKVTAIGTKTKPIKFIAKDNTKPWGLIALQGKATSGSKFHYCYIENGSVDTRNLIHYTAQFNIHDMDNFEVKNSFIGKNYIGDDAMHIAYSTGLVDNCIFDGARSDGLDIDISDVNITNNIFKNSGNDGLDIMTTTMTASNNTFIDTGDKGISVGEWSDANITDSTFTRTMIGLEIKDKSKVVANNLTFVNTKDKAINLYNKNKRYDTGGFMQATNLKFIGNHVIKTDVLSKTVLRF